SYRFTRGIQRDREYGSRSDTNKCTFEERITMQLIQFWLVAATVPPVALLQWWAMRTTHRKGLAAAHARHREAQQSAATLLQQSRQQIAQLQQELAAARLAAKCLTRVEPPRSTVSPAERDCLM